MTRWLTIFNDGSGVLLEADDALTAISMAQVLSPGKTVFACLWRPTDVYPVGALQARIDLLPLGLA